MVSFIMDNIATIIVSLAVLAVIVFIVFRMRSDKKQGKSSCGCGCKDCANAVYCHGANKSNNND